MKKVIILILSICVAMCALSACKSSCKIKETDKYQLLNSMLEENYSQITISVNNTFTDEDITLESVYTVKYSQTEITVEYKVERFASLSLDNPTTEVKTVIEGTATIKDGVVSGGEDAGITADIAKIGLSFKEQYFKNVLYTGKYISADVTDASGFLGTELTCTDMHVEAKFNKVFTSIEISYVQGGNEVEYSYVFNS